MVSAYDVSTLPLRPNATRPCVDTIQTIRLPIFMLGQPSLNRYSMKFSPALRLYRPTPPNSGWKLILRILKRNRRTVAAILAATLGVYASSLSIPIVIQYIIDNITARQPALFIAGLGAFALALSVADVFLADARRLMVIALGQRVDRHIALEIMSHILGARIDVASHDTGEILNRTEQTDKIRSFMVNIIPSSIFDIGGAGIAIILIFAYSIQCGAMILAIITVGFLLSKKILGDFYTNVFSMFKLRSQRQGNLAETVGGLATIKALAVEPGRFRLWSRKTRSVVDAEGDLAQIIRRYFQVSRLSRHLLALVIVGVGGYQMMHGALTAGELFAILMLTEKVSGPLLSSADVIRQFQDVAVAVAELGRLLDAPPERSAAARPLRAPLDGLEFRNVTYRYHGGAAPAVAGVSLTFPETGLIAVIGRNGSGKSTVLRLIQGLLRDFEGDIRIGGADIRAFHPRWLRSQMAVVNQDTTLFAGTVRENVTSWASGVSDEQIVAALKLSGAWDFVSELPDGLDAKLTENAANLSGGQRQRLSVARAVLRDPKIILLDEPTAFLDAEAAVRLEERLGEWGKGRLMILVSHHLAATRGADRIILMDRGAVVAQGSHTELLKDCELYRSLWSDYLRGADWDQAGG